jgi:hypothetical protein
MPDVELLEDEEQPVRVLFLELSYLPASPSLPHTTSAGGGLENSFRHRCLDVSRMKQISEAKKKRAEASRLEPSSKDRLSALKLELERRKGRGYPSLLMAAKATKYLPLYAKAGPDVEFLK